MPRPLMTEEEEDEMAARQARIDALMPSAKTPEELAMEQKSLRGQAKIAGQKAYDDKSWTGGGLLGVGLAAGLNKLGWGRGDSPEERAETAYKGLEQSRQQEAMKRRRLGLDEATKTVEGELFKEDTASTLSGRQVTAADLANENKMEAVTEADIVDRAQATRQEQFRQRAATVADNRRKTAAAKAATVARRAAYTSARMADQAEIMTKASTSADTAFENNLSLDQFMLDSAEGREGGAAPILSSVQNFMTTLGFTAEGLEEVAGMKQSEATILARYMEALGARGLTDKDMEILRETLPQMGTSREAREKVVRILKRNNNEKLFKYVNAMDKEKLAFPDMYQNEPSWYEDVVDSPAYGAYQELDRRKRAARAERRRSRQ